MAAQRVVTQQARKPLERREFCGLAARIHQALHEAPQLGEWSHAPAEVVASRRMERKLEQVEQIKQHIGRRPQGMRHREEDCAANVLEEGWE